MTSLAIYNVYPILSRGWRDILRVGSSGRSFRSASSCTKKLLLPMKNQETFNGSYSNLISTKVIRLTKLLTCNYIMNTKCSEYDIFKDIWGEKTMVLFCSLVLEKSHCKHVFLVYHIANCTSTKSVFPS